MEEKKIQLTVQLAPENVLFLKNHPQRIKYDSSVSGILRLIIDQAMEEDLKR